MDLSLLKTDETYQFHGQYRANSEFRAFIALCKQRILHPQITSNDYDEFWQWIAPSWYISNGYFENYIEPTLLKWMLSKHGVESTVILNKTLHTINFITLFAPLNVQEELLKWLLSLDQKS